jgi:HlyD family secretion protein
MAESSAEDIRKAIGAGATGVSTKVWVVAGAIVVASCVVVGVQRLHSGSSVNGPAYETATVSRADVRVVVTATGSLEALSTIEVGAEVTGKVSAVSVDANDQVTKGELLALIDPEQLRASAEESSAQVASAAASVLQATATLVEASKEGQRAREQASRGLISAKDLEAATAAEERAQAGVSSAQASAALARARLTQTLSRLEKTKIVSPIDGIVLSRHVERGQTVTAGYQTPLLFRLAQDLSQMRLGVDVDEADVGRVRDGEEATFTVDAYPDRTFSSRVLSLGNEPKASHGVVTYESVLTVDNHERLLRPGMTCTATILADTRKAVLVVPNAALRFAPPTVPDVSVSGETKPGPAEAATAGGGKRQRVWVLTNGTPVEVVVRTGATDGRVTEIGDGDLAPGTPVIVDVKAGG